jgi:5-formyltetrahydrofolate cyclo-ligase
MLASELVEKMRLTKAALRAEVFGRLKKVTPEQRADWSREIQSRLFALPEFQKAQWVHFYIAVGHEVETPAMIEAAIREGKKVAVPVIRPRRAMILSELRDPERELVVGPLGVPQPKPSFIRPVPTARMDLFLLPGVAFDTNGRRLGRGAGYYDRLLHAVRRPLWALAFENQIVPAVPVSKNDIRVGRIITESRLIDCNLSHGRTDH